MPRDRLVRPHPGRARLEDAPLGELGDGQPHGGAHRALDVERARELGGRAREERRAFTGRHAVGHVGGEPVQLLHGRVLATYGRTEVSNHSVRPPAPVMRCSRRTAGPPGTSAWSAPTNRSWSSGWIRSSRPGEQPPTSRDRPEQGVRARAHEPGHEGDRVEDRRDRAREPLHESLVPALRRLLPLERPELQRGDGVPVGEPLVLPQELRLVPDLLPGAVQLDEPRDLPANTSGRTGFTR